MSYKKGVICGNFDVIHPGYIAMFKEMSENCDWLKTMVDAGEIFHPLRWDVSEASHFLADVPLVNPIRNGTKSIISLANI